MASVIGAGIWRHVLADEMKELEAVHAVFHASAMLKEITPDGVKCVDGNGNEMEVKADAVVLSMGVAPKRDIVKAFKDDFENTIVIGDANQSGRILEATTDGFTKAWLFD